MLNKIRKIKTWQVILFILIIGIVFLGVKYINEHTYSTDRWIKYPDDRVKMVNDLFRKHTLASHSKDQVVELLGPDTENAYFKKIDNMVYYLGPERGLISIDSEWLVIEFDNNTVVDYHIKRD